MSGHLDPVRLPATGPVIIPARLDSSRLTKKLLLDQTGQPLLAHAIERAQQTQQLSEGLVSDVVVACDDERLCDVARACGAKSLITSGNHSNGTSRVAEAIELLGLADAADFVINLQADQPELSPNDVVALAEWMTTHPSSQVATLAVEIRGGQDELWNSPHAVKVVLNPQHRAIGFSRSLARQKGTGHRASTTTPWYYHVGIYVYRTEVLLGYARLPAAELERRERLEQLRLLEAGVPIDVLVIRDKSPPQSVDTPESYAAFVERWKRACPGR